MGVPQEVLDILTDVGLGEHEHTSFVTHLYHNVGQDKWFPTMQKRFTKLDDGLLLLLILAMKR